MSVRNGEFQVVGDKKKPSQKPISSPSSDPRSGRFQFVGDQVKLNKNSGGGFTPSANPSSGTFQKVGDTVTLNRTAIKGWGSAASLPMSKRTIEQDKNASKKRK